jgi:hypothetical protein
MKILLMFALLAAPALAEPIQIQILSGKVNVDGPEPDVFLLNFNVTTDCGSLTGVFPGFSGFFFGDETKFFSTTITGGANTLIEDSNHLFYSMATIKHNGFSYNYEGGSLDSVSGSLLLANDLTITPTGPDTFVVPFTAQFGIGLYPNGCCDDFKDFQYTGSGTATFQFSIFPVGGGIYSTDFIGATYAFGVSSVPEPASGAGVLFCFVLLAGVKMANCRARQLDRATRIARDTRVNLEPTPSTQLTAIK